MPGARRAPGFDPHDDDPRSAPRAPDPAPGGRIGERHLARPVAELVDAVMGLAQSIGQVVFWSAIGGIGNGAYGTAFLTAVQERTPEVHQACVNALYDLIGSVGPGLGFVAAGAIAADASPRAVYVVARAGAPAALGATAALLRDADWSLAPLALAAPDR